VRRVAAIALILAACSKPPAQQPSYGGRPFGAGGGVGATITGSIDTGGSQDSEPDVSASTTVSTSSTSTTTTTNSRPGLAFYGKTA
jgi:hypothetical protein